MGTDHGVTMHSDGCRPGNPAVNVKVHTYRAELEEAQP